MPEKMITNKMEIKKIMNYLILTFLFTATLTTATIYDDVFQSEWDYFKIKYQKSYNSPAEEKNRIQIFSDTKYKIAANNEKYFAGEADFEMGINQFSDMLPEEINVMYYNELNDKDWADLKSKPFFAPEGEVPKYVNWLEKGAVTPVRDQKSCGSCYAFAGIAALESHHYIKNKKLEVFSVQEIVDCSKGYGNNGCNGGLAQKSYRYLMACQGINHESSYPYEARDGTCRVNHTDIGAQVIGFVNPRFGDEEDLMKAVAQGPVSVSIDASLSSFHNYKSGIYYDPNCSSERLGHAVLIVGYGTDEATKRDYWIIKNSWGSTWGDNGYIKMARNVNNMCGPATRPVFPIVA